jgi:putative SOS response-associated peptidase YedK
VCGRFALFTPPVRLARFLQATLAEGVDPEAPPSWNVPPTRSVLGVVERPDDEGEVARFLETFRWGLVPSWAKDFSVGGRLFNARSESVASKPSFRAAFTARRALIPADGFYEWARPNHGPKQPHYFTRADGDPLAFAGLWEVWRDPDKKDDAEPRRTCTIITTSASQDIDGIHDRMPVILEAAAFEPWLDPANHDRDLLQGLLGPAPPGTLIHHPVDRRVGNSRADGPELIEEAGRGREVPAEVTREPG